MGARAAAFELDDRQAPLDELIASLAQSAVLREQRGRPLVSLCYAQSLDGSIAVCPAQATDLSGPESSRLTHRLRAAHDAILVGIGTVLIDNPRLTVRLVSGANPQPVILDSHLRTPLSAALLQPEHPKPAWIATTSVGDPEKRLALMAANIRLVELPAAADGRIELEALLLRLGEMGINSLMVEGGAGVISAFLRLGLVDQAILTVVPRWLGGLAPAELAASARRLEKPAWAQLGDDLVVWGRVI
jgi:3,4-dihydroxy 2-butanone 4-phosphate synthase/GTP cyclohydrolase II